MAEYDHLSGLEEQMTRKPFEMPRLVINKHLSLEDFITLPDQPTEELLKIFSLKGYQSHPAINFKVAD